ncbi:hypothetical protein ABK905_11060 [Acerihabitans sp. KWT182]|uniref:Uncharacterized protein n=1 Tax=Acerihabitans sp. KWT182 TaxID=3157919 RepID=A0AAU7QER3_9GAMM
MAPGAETEEGAAEGTIASGVPGGVAPGTETEESVAEGVMANGAAGGNRTGRRNAR